MFFHNLKYDSSLFIRELTKYEGGISVIAATTENYIAITKTVRIQTNYNKTVYVNAFDDIKDGNSDIMYIDEDDAEIIFEETEYSKENEAKRKFIQIIFKDSYRHCRLA